MGIGMGVIRNLREGLFVIELRVLMRLMMLRSLSILYYRLAFMFLSMRIEYRISCTFSKIEHNHTSKIKPSRVSNTLIF